MTPRERVLAVLSGRQPDRVPRMANFYPETLPELGKRGAEGDYFGTEIRFVEFEPPPQQEAFLDYLEGLPTDVYVGTTPILRNYAHWGYFPHVEGFSRLNQPNTAAELAAELALAPLPEFSQDQVARLADEVAGYHGRGLAVMGTPPHLGGELFETAWRLRGWSQFMVDLKRNPELAHTLLDQLTAMTVATALILVRAGVDILGLDDDVGAPAHMIIGPDTWRRFLRPRLETIIRSGRALNPDLKIFYHSDGYIEPIIPELIEIGVDVIHPVQPDVMDPDRLKARFGDRLAFWGTVGTQATWGWPNAEAIRAEVRHRIETVGQGGGLILGPAYDLEPRIPWENIVAFFEAAEAYGVYP
jgi:uroporphyrinogen decarboxylase